jgi:Lrp/AsnC family transcriptional regulator
MNIDRIDKEILRIIQQDASLTTAEIAEQVGLTTTPCWRRIQRMQELGIILKRVTLLQPEKLNLGLTVFVHVKVAKHDANWFKKFLNFTDLAVNMTTCLKS